MFQVFEQMKAFSSFKLSTESNPSCLTYSFPLLGDLTLATAHISHRASAVDEVAVSTHTRFILIGLGTLSLGLFPSPLTTDPLLTQLIIHDIVHRKRCTGKEFDL